MDGAAALTLRGNGTPWRRTPSAGGKAPWSGVAERGGLGVGVRGPGGGRGGGGGSGRIIQYDDDGGASHSGVKVTEGDGYVFFEFD